MILILTDKNDSHANHVVPMIQEAGMHYFRLDLDVDSLLKTYVTYKGGEWVLLQDGRCLNASDVSCVWHRRTFVELYLDQEYDQTADFKIWKNEWNKTLLGLYASCRSKPWLNPWRKAYESENKYLQMEIAKKYDLNVPPLITSNDKVEVVSFASSNESVVLKLMHQDFYRNEAKEHLGLYVNKVSKDEVESFKGSEENPIVLQKYVQKSFEVRYTVVGQRHFVCKIESQKSKVANIDWRRYDIPNTPHSSIEAPCEITASVNAMMAELGIQYGALDFIVDEEGSWWFLEVNSMGQFLWIEDLSGLEISKEIVKWLKNHYIY